MAAEDPQALLPGRSWRRTMVLVFLAGAGGAFAFILCLVIFFFCFSGSIGSREPRRTVSAAPPIQDRRPFFGTMGSFDATFAEQGQNAKLERGPGNLTGAITVDGRPAPGVKIRLGLNGGVMTEWAESGASGEYQVPVPYGEYRVDGYEIDHHNAHDRLGGKTDAPANGIRFFGRKVIVVNADKPSGHALDLAYIEPVTVLGPTGDVSASRPIVVSWKQYPGASGYRIQLTEHKQPDDFRSERQIFNWNDRPTTKSTSIELTDKQFDLKKGRYYTIDVDALDDHERVIATSGNRFGVTDFRVVD